VNIKDDKPIILELKNNVDSGGTAAREALMGMGMTKKHY
jgi:hypothetical protein